MQINANAGTDADADADADYHADSHAKLMLMLMLVLMLMHVAAYFRPSKKFGTGKIWELVSKKFSTEKSLTIKSDSGQHSQFLRCFFFNFVVRVKEVNKCLFAHEGH